MGTFRMLLVSAALFAGTPLVVAGQGHEAAHEAHQSADSAAVAAAVEAYHMALSSMDTARVESLLADDVRVLESGGMETREEYLSHHLPGDMRFAAALNRDRGPIEVRLMGDVAWAVSTSRTTGSFRDREIDSRGVELMVLTREGEEWKIRAIHWSSR